MRGRRAGKVRRGCTVQIQMCRMQVYPRPRTSLREKKVGGVGGWKGCACCYRLLPRCHGGTSCSVADADVYLHLRQPSEPLCRQFRPEHRPEPVHDDIFNSPLKVELAEGSDSHWICVVSPHAGRGLTFTLLRGIFGRGGLHMT